MTQHICRIPLHFTKPLPEIVERATDIGRDSGLDADWEPENITQAAWEILISSGDPEANGLRVLPASQAGDRDVFVLQVALRLRTGDDAVLQHCRDFLGEAPASLDEACAALLSLQLPPMDFGIEIEDVLEPESSHDRIAETFRAECALRLA